MNIWKVFEVINNLLIWKYMIKMNNKLLNQLIFSSCKYNLDIAVAKFVIKIAMPL